jgi:DNA-binding response OmpR family regulator
VTSQRVLVVEDDDDIRNLLVARLDRLGYRVEPCRTGEAAVASALAEPPDLVLLDVLLPGIDGWDVARRLRDEPLTVDVPVLVVSIVADGTDPEPGVVARITKPFRVRDVEAMVRALIGPALAEGA